METRRAKGWTTEERKKDKALQEKREQEIMLPLERKFTPHGGQTTNQSQDNSSINNIYKLYFYIQLSPLWTTFTLMKRYHNPADNMVVEFHDPSYITLAFLWLTCYDSDVFTTAHI